MPEKNTVDRRNFLSTIGQSFCYAAPMLALTPKGNGQARRTGKPNIVFILVDDLGWADVG